MMVFLNGRFVAEEQAVVSVFDRGFLFGDGLFETLRFCAGKPFRWAQHLDRLQRGADLLKLRLPYSPDALRDHADELVRINRMPDAVLRITVSRGAGPRGYSPAGANAPTVVMSLHPSPTVEPNQPPSWKLIVASTRVPADDPLTAVKSANKLLQVLARAEADAAGADEALLTNTRGTVAEGTSANLFWFEGGRVYTPPLTDGALPGITRAVLFELCPKMGLAALEASVQPAQLTGAEAVFLTLSSLGIIEAVSLDGRPLRTSPMVSELARAYWRAVRDEAVSVEA